MNRRSFGTVEDFHSAAVAPAPVDEPDLELGGFGGGAAAADDEEEKSQENIDLDTIGFDHTSNSAKTMPIR